MKKKYFFCVVTLNILFRSGLFLLVTGNMLHTLDVFPLRSHRMIITLTWNGMKSAFTNVIYREIHDEMSVLKKDI